MPHPAWITHSISFCVGAAATAAVGIALQISTIEDDGTANAKQQKQPRRSGASAAVLAPRGDDATTTMLPLLTTRIYQPNNDFTIAFDTRSKNPLFVMERLTSNHIQRSTSTLQPDDDYNANEVYSGAVVASRKNKRFHEEQSLQPYHRSRNQYYRNSGYDRGHLAPAADFASNDKKMNDTFVLTNASPQLPRFNRTLWLRLEEFVRMVARGQSRSVASSSTDTNSETWVVTGPLWLPSSTTRRDSSGEDIFHYSYEGIGKPPSLIAVPTHFYKVVVVVERPSSSSSKKEDEDESVDESDVQTKVLRSPSIVREASEEMILKEFAAFVVPNADIMGTDGSFRLVDHIVRLTDLEAVTGLEFFPALFGTNHNTVGANNYDTIPLRKQIADALTDDIRLGGPNIIDRRDEYKPSGNKTSSALVPLSAGDGEEYSKGRRKKIQQILRESSSISFHHLCETNELCYKILNA